MKILSIETSCDETGISIMEAKGGVNKASFKVLADNVASQIAIHAPYGGVFPALAKREHIKNLPLVLEKTLKEAGLGEKAPTPSRVGAPTKSVGDKKPVDLIAVTYGPGLEPALWTGIVLAKELAKKWRVPLIPVNHMEGHLLSVFGKNKGKFGIPKVKMPALALLVSGGHTELVLVKKWMQYQILGETLDDAVGEAFDKVARMLGLPYPGGPEISRLAEEARLSSPKQGMGANPHTLLGANFKLPRPMIYAKNFEFSFSGLKTAVLYLIRDLGGLEKINAKTKSEIALEFENAAIECLTHKTKKAIEQYKIQTIVVGGGVAANQHLRNEMKKLAGKKIKLLFPNKELSTDNSVTIGIAGYLNFVKNKRKVPKATKIKATGNLRL